MYYDKRNNKELTHISFAKKARPGVSFPRHPTEEQLLALDIATVIVPQEVDKTDFNTLKEKHVEVINDVYTLKYTYENIGLSSAKTKKIKEIWDYVETLINTKLNDVITGKNPNKINKLRKLKDKFIYKNIKRIHLTEDEDLLKRKLDKFDLWEDAIYDEADSFSDIVEDYDTVEEIVLLDVNEQNWATLRLEKLPELP